VDIVSKQDVYARFHSWWFQVSQAKHNGRLNLRVLSERIFPKPACACGFGGHADAEKARAMNESGPTAVSTSSSDVFISQRPSMFYDQVGKSHCPRHQCQRSWMSWYRHQTSIRAVCMKRLRYPNDATTPKSPSPQSPHPSIPAPHLIPSPKTHLRASAYAMLLFYFSG